MDKRVVIIGSGIGGLECGYILAKHGMKVIVLEQDAQIGGCLQTFRRRASDGSVHTFDTGFHYVGGLGEGQSLYPLFRYFGLMDLPWRQLDSECFDEVFFCGGDSRMMLSSAGHLNVPECSGLQGGFPLASGHDRFVERLTEYFPHQRENLKKYAAFLKSVGDNIFKAFSPDSEMNALFGRSAYEFLCETITDPQLRNVLSGTSLKLELNRDTLPLYEFAQINNSFIQSAWRLGEAEVTAAGEDAGTRGRAGAVRKSKISGGALIAGKLADAITAMGGEIRTNAKVVKINVDESDGKVSGVTFCPGMARGCNQASAFGGNASSECASERNDGSDGNEYSGKMLPATEDICCGEFIPADWVISDAHPAVTVWLIEECRQVRKIYRHRIDGLKNTSGIFTANLVLKDGALPYLNRNLFIHRDKADLWNPDSSRTESVMVHFYPATGSSLLDSQSHASGHTCIDLLSQMDWVGVQQWSDGRIGHRGEDYEAVKQKKLEECIKLADRALRPLVDRPLGEVVDTAYTSTPLTWRSYTGTPCGSAYGVAKDWTNPMATVLSPRTPLPNLLMTGQSLNLHGILGVSMTSVLTCMSILGQSLVREILSEK